MSSLHVSQPRTAEPVNYSLSNCFELSIHLQVVCYSRQTDFAHKSAHYFELCTEGLLILTRRPVNWDIIQHWVLFNNLKRNGQCCRPRH